MVDDVLHILARDLGDLEAALERIPYHVREAMGLEGFRQEHWPAAREVVVHYTDEPKEAGR